ncbi:MAG TPA: FlgD immunoglobulin-like domain containing protein [Gaiellaceae bacterium]|nr:FlgD immunoglobulin-like domain containing protein [Gaiellaceae bacterium]
MSVDSLRRARVLVAVVVTFLLGGTAAAFALTEQLKLERSPVLRTSVGKLLGPRCHCPMRRVKIGFVLRKPDTITVVIVDSQGQIVRTLLSGGYRRGAQQFAWDGRNDFGGVVPAGTYKPRLHLAHDHRTILMPNPIRVDPTAPAVALVSLAPRVFSPDGDGRRDVVRVRFKTSEPARGLLYVDGGLRIRTKRYAYTGVLRWYGAGFGGGRHRLVLRAVDLAGNRSKPVPVGIVRIRFVTVGPHVLRAKTGARVGFRVRADARRFTWRLGKRHGSSGPGLLVLRTPSAPGRYRLVVTANGHSARALVIVS